MYKGLIKIHPFFVFSQAPQFPNSFELPRDFSPQDLPKGAALDPDLRHYKGAPSNINSCIRACPGRYMYHLYWPSRSSSDGEPGILEGFPRSIRTTRGLSKWRNLTFDQKPRGTPDWGSVWRNSRWRRVDWQIKCKNWLKGLLIKWVCFLYFYTICW